MSDFSPTPRQTRSGVASAIIGGSLPLLVLLLFVLSVSVAVGRPHSKTLHDAFGIAFFIVGVLAPPLHLTGLILGVIGANARDRQRSCAVAGIVLNAFFGLIGFGIIWLLFTKTPWSAFR